MGSFVDSVLVLAGRCQTQSRCLPTVINESENTEEAQAEESVSCKSRRVSGVVKADISGFE